LEDEGFNTPLYHDGHCRNLLWWWWWSCLSIRSTTHLVAVIIITATTTSSFFVLTTQFGHLCHTSKQEENTKSI
jgi:hypothetical protein